MYPNAARNATADPDPAPPPKPTHPDLLTVAAIAIAATVIADIIHEGLGHGGMCLATGGRALVISTVHFDCSADTRLVAAGGTLANLVFGSLFWFAQRAVKRSAPWRYFFWLLMTFNLLSAGGYFLFSGIGNIGDWAVVVAGWQPAWAWRIGLTALGAVVYFLMFVPLSVRELRPFLGRPFSEDSPSAHSASENDAHLRVRRARQLTVTPYLTAGVLACVAGALNPVGPLLILISAAAASFGGNSGLAWMWTLLQGPRIPSTEFQMPEIKRSPAWIVAAILLAIAFIAGLGPGVKFHSLQRIVCYVETAALGCPFERSSKARVGRTLLSVACRGGEAADTQLTYACFSKTYRAPV